MVSSSRRGWTECQDLLGVMTIGADRGAELVFRYGIGVAGEAPHPTEREDEPGSDGAAHEVAPEAEAAGAPPSGSSDQAPPRPQDETAPPAPPKNNHHHNHKDHKH